MLHEAAVRLGRIEVRIALQHIRDAIDRVASSVSNELRTFEKMVLWRSDDHQSDVRERAHEIRVVVASVPDDFRPAGGQRGEHRRVGRLETGSIREKSLKRARIRARRPDFFANGGDQLAHALVGHTRVKT